jgi:hypothetical protein
VVAAKRPLVTTNYAIAELLALLTARTRLSSPQVVQFVSQVKTLAQSIYIDQSLDDAAMALLQQYTVQRQGMVIGGRRQVRRHAAARHRRSLHHR